MIFWEIIKLSNKKSKQFRDFENPELTKGKKKFKIMLSDGNNNQSTKFIRIDETNFRNVTADEKWFEFNLSPSEWQIKKQKTISSSPAFSAFPDFFDDDADEIFQSPEAVSEYQIPNCMENLPVFNILTGDPSG